ncbi:lipopolysaccharide-binding protein-like [Phoca vitulina]|uniref:lipopolysaccharide-binding protein-like n=1 Tax=Phoca vitulina TaxID=9720 RepID=UPI0013963D6B|nr:lipopolysaccharide-binding protein-like [Phoca vitulina]
MSAHTELPPPQGGHVEVHWWAKWHVWSRCISPVLHQVELLEALLNYYILNTLYPKVNGKLAEGFPLPLLKDIRLYDPVLEIHKDFLFLGTNLHYVRA